MPTVTANLTWDPVPGSYGTLIEYKEVGDILWITPTTPDNPTLLNTYPLELETATVYTVRLSTQSPTCGVKYIYKQITTPETACCPVGYTLSPDSTYCYQESVIAATPPSGGTPATSVAVKNDAYGTCGARIYNLGYSTNGVGTSTLIPTSNAFWINGVGGSCVDNPAQLGPLNRNGLWISTIMSNQTVGFAICLDLPESDIYYVGMGCDNEGIIKLDGVTILDQDATAVGAQYGMGVDATFKLWHIYPVSISSGPHILEVIGFNVSGAASVGIEVYNNTSSEILSATGYSDLNMVFKSADFIGQPIQLGSGSLGYSCPPGYSLNTCDDPVTCVQFLTTSPISC